MSDADGSGFGKFIPGFDFMQNLARQTSGGLVQGVQQAVPQLPNLGSWVAPTFNVEDLEKRIQELKAVHFWLDQNTRALSATIQALEVQKMTLATLQGMNLSMGDVANALKVKATDTMAGMAGLAGLAGLGGFGGVSAKPDAAPAQPPVAPEPVRSPTAPAPSPYFFSPAPAPAPVPVPAPAPEVAPEPVAASAANAPAPGRVDPMQWWGSLTQQFQTIAANALKDNAAQTAMEAGKHIASALTREAVKTTSEMTSGLTKALVGQGQPAAADGGDATTAAAVKKTAARPAAKKAAAPPATKTSTTAGKTAVQSAPPAAKKAPAKKTVANKSAKPASGGAGRSR